MQEDGHKAFAEALSFAFVIVIVQVLWIVVLYYYVPWLYGSLSSIISLVVLPAILVHYVLWRFWPRLFRRWLPALALIYTYVLLLFVGAYATIAVYFIANSLKAVWVYTAIIVFLLFLGWLSSKTLRIFRVPHRMASLMTALFAGWLVFWLVSNVLIKVRGNHWGQEAKQNLHAIQLAVERYCLDKNHYPEFLIGGAAELGNVSERPIATVIDPLGSLGYMPSYPRLKASRREAAVNRIPVYGQEEMGFWRRVFLKEGAPFIANLGDFRRLQDEFGDTYTIDNDYSRFIGEKERPVLMGNLAADHRYEDAKWGFPYWLREMGSKDLITITSQFNFCYKSLKSPGAHQPDGYILMVFGPYCEEGQDAFTTVPGGHELDGRLPDGTGIGMGVPVIAELGLEPDGKRDGVILVLHGGWPWQD